MEKRRHVITYGDYFHGFFEKQTPKVRDKIMKILDIIEYLPVIPINYLKFIEETDRLYV